MLFHSLEFAIFLPLVFILYWGLNKRRYQNALLIVASYVFYGWWDWRFLSLIVISSAADYIIGRALGKTDAYKKRKILLIMSIAINIGILGSFKYYGFFVENISDAFTFLGLPFSLRSLNVILPVGISFYTFQTMSYTIDVYKKKIEPTRDIISFFAYVSFFPQLVAGPIERAHAFLPQFIQPRTFNYTKAVDGLRQMLWGLFKKVVIADLLASHVDLIFANYRQLSGSELALGAIFFSFQIYCDFSAYSDIAIGVSRLFGFSLMRNFNYPYFSRDIAEFWRRWHISLSSWFRDYIYIPLGGSQVKRFALIRNVLVVFVISGLWHGASWNFVVWGMANALAFLPLLLMHKNRTHIDIPSNGKLLPSFSETIQMVGTFSLVALLWVLFRSPTLTDAVAYYSHLFSASLFTIPQQFRKYIPLVVVLVVIEWSQRNHTHPLFNITKLPALFRWTAYTSLALATLAHSAADRQFIYFQF